MRKRVIPAQITTTQDTIEGNISLSQMLILITPIILTTLIYMLIPTPMEFTPVKLTLSGTISFFTVLLAFKLKGKLVLEWLLILSRYHARSKYFVFNKATTFARTVYTKREGKEAETEEAEEQKVLRSHHPSVRELLDLKNLINKKELNATYRVNGKGGLHVAFEKV